MCHNRRKTCNGWKFFCKPDEGHSKRNCHGVNTCRWASATSMHPMFFPRTDCSNQTRSNTQCVYGAILYDYRHDQNLLLRRYPSYLTIFSTVRTCTRGSNFVVTEPENPGLPSITNKNQRYGNWKHYRNKKERLKDTNSRWYKQNTTHSKAERTRSPFEEGLYQRSIKEKPNSA